jgi:FtsH-binding integral membrane protein
MQDFTKYNPNSAAVAAGSVALSSEALFFQRVYTWMFAGLALTAATSFVLASSEAWLTLLFSNRFVFYGTMIVQLGLVMYLSARINSLSVGAARGIFLAYSALTGVFLSAFLVLYPSAAFIKAFVCTAGIYGALALYGLLTKKSLNAWGNFLFMGAVGLFLAIVVNVFFVESAQLDLVICVLGVIIFAGLTAYDHQKLRVIHYSLGNSGGGAEAAETEGRVVIMGALNLYLDFINIFFFLLRLFARK